MQISKTHTVGLRPAELLLIAGFAVALRVAVFTAALLSHRVTFTQYTNKGDTSSYIAVASAMSGERPYGSIDEYDRRVFPGYPALIAVVHGLHVPLPLAAVCVTWLCAGIAAATAAKAFGDSRVGWGMTCLIPHYLINSSLGMSEAPLLAGVCAAFLLSRSDRIIPAGIVFGLAALIRPMACFALAGVVFTAVRDRRWARAATLCTAAGFVFASGFVAMQQWTGNALQGVHVYANHPGAYAGHMFVWPFQSLLEGTEHASPGRNIYIWMHVIVVLTAISLAARRALASRRPDPRDSTSFPWLLLNTAFVLCLGPPWGFSHFPRFSIPAAPAMFWTLRRFLPSDRLPWLAIATACFGIGVLGVIDSP